ncbi:hypothetical protein C723_1852 [Christiangramia flava JLT2011]|uniref:Uncharacterized protein n=1 Tax=Christiangramia flava JLT2011 TaxID=1229726 RepID=A0A1L7I8Y2_9FLAO|nr:hypothetical protein GRFL_2939 [Christiangramia flava JLT2011]OSS39306.1 hypothetical protein C723_1852 [Christiangramia flava JLT2011]
MKKRMVGPSVFYQYTVSTLGLLETIFEFNLKGKKRLNYFVMR